jgi:N-acetylhexosamine 1-kinase
MVKIVGTVLQHYFTSIRIHDVSVLPGGLIHQTLLVKTDKGDFVLQKINQNVFKNAKALIENKSKVVSYLHSRNISTIKYIKTLSGEDFYLHEEEMWQLSEYIPSFTIHRLNKEKAVKTGKLLSQFHEALQDFPVNDLQITIPDFHNTENRFSDLISRIASASLERLKAGNKSIDFLIENYYKIFPVVKATNNGEIPVRVAHNDTKVSNILFDSEGNTNCLIDFDTLMPGSILYDVGDAMRSGANMSDENEKDLTMVIFDKEVYESFISSYMEGAKSFLSDIELKYIHMSLPLILFEQACRFLEDYLNNDSYYSVDYEDHNLVRTKTQIKLFQEVTEYLEINKLMQPFDQE